MKRQNNGNELRSSRGVWAITVAVCCGIFIGRGALGQQPPPEKLVFDLVAQLAGPDNSRTSAKTGDQPVQIRAADYSLNYARRNFAPVMQGAVAIGDMNGDGAPDLFVAGAGRLNLLLQGNGDGRFRDITGPAGVAGPEDSLSAAFSDYDKSGRQSLFVAGVGGVTLYHNDGNNSFSQITQKAGLQMAPGILCTGVALGDLDGDGLPDLVVAAYTNLDHPPSKPVFTFPNDFAGIGSRLYRNNGDGTFTDVTESAGLGENPGRARKAVLADFNGDQRLDIVLLRDDKPPVLYLNRGGWKFVDATWEAGDDLTTHAFFEGAAEDFNRDGKMDLVLWSSHSFRVLINDGHAVFERVGTKSLPEPVISLFGFRGLAADLDGDGFDDLVTVDQKGRLRAFGIQSDAFHEVSLALPPGFEDSYLFPLRLGEPRRTYLLAFPQDGRIALLGMKADEGAK